MTLYKESVRFKLQNCKYVCLLFILFISYEQALAFQQINACNGSSVLTPEITLPVQWSYAWKNITFRLSSNPTRCKNGEETKAFYDQSDDQDESPYPHFTPDGYLATKEGPHTHFFNDKEYCIQTVNESYLEVKICSFNCSGNSPCINKCCPIGKSINLEGLDSNETAACTSSGENRWQPFLYSSPENPVSDEDKSKINLHYIHYLLNCKEDMSMETWYTRDMMIDNSTQLHTNAKLLQDGSLWYVAKNRRWKPFKDGQFCIDGLQNFGEGEFYSGSEKDQVIIFCQKRMDETQISWLYMVVMYSASLFLLLTCIVYILLWDRQNIHGWTVFSVVLSMFLMFIFLATAHLLGLIGTFVTSFDIRNSSLCILNGIAAHFFFLSTFTWLTVMNFDLWWTFKSLESMSERSKGKKRFLSYLPFAWGIPTVIVTVGYILDELYEDPNSMVMTPEYGNLICFIAPWAQGVYLYYIVAFLLFLNAVLVCTTFFNLYKLKKGTSSIRSSKSNYQTDTITLVGKLSVIMGISWIFEVISWAVTEGEGTPWWWVICDMYNLLQAVLIFIIFVCKRKIANQLEHKYPVFKIILAPCKSVLSTASGSSESDTATTLNGRKEGTPEKPSTNISNSRAEIKRVSESEI